MIPGIKLKQSRHLCHVCLCHWAKSSSLHLTLLMPSPQPFVLPFTTAKVKHPAVHSRDVTVTDFCFPPSLAPQMWTWYCTSPPPEAETYPLRVGKWWIPLPWLRAGLSLLFTEQWLSYKHFTVLPFPLSSSHFSASRTWQTIDNPRPKPPTLVPWMAS